jgi:hypothetical protein
VLSVDVCLQSDVSISKFSGYLVESALTVESNNLQFAKAVQDYKQLTNKNTRSNRADIVFSKFLASGAPSSVQASADTTAEIQASMDSDKFPKDLFKKASVAAKQSLVPSFDKHLAANSAKQDSERVSEGDVVTDRLELARNLAIKKLEDMRALSS